MSDREMLQKLKPELDRLLERYNKTKDLNDLHKANEWRMKYAKLNLKGGGVLELAVDDIVDYSQTRKGSMLIYMQDGEKKVVEVYETPSRIKNAITGGKK